MVNTRRFQLYALFVFRRVTGCLTLGMSILSAGENAVCALEENDMGAVDYFPGLAGNLVYCMLSKNLVHLEMRGMKKFKKKSNPRQPKEKIRRVKIRQAEYDNQTYLAENVFKSRTNTGLG